MKEKFSFLKDPRALLEIRKHKWIESEKRGQEIGFATAAVDWVKKYGEAWKAAYLKEDTEDALFIEKRRYRRFTFDLGLVIKGEEADLAAEPKDISLEAISCRISQRLPADAPIELIFKPRGNVKSGPNSFLRCRAKILKVTASFKKNLDSPEYNVVLIPSEECRRFLKGIVSERLYNSTPN